MFARKFDPEVDASILDAIDLLRERDQAPQDGAFFRGVMVKQTTAGCGGGTWPAARRAAAPTRRRRRTRRT